MEPYITSEDFVRLAFEIIFCVWVVHDITSLVIVLVKIITDRDGYQKGDEVFSMWYFIDCVNYFNFCQFIYYRLRSLPPISTRASPPCSPLPSSPLHPVSLPFRSGLFHSGLSSPTPASLIAPLALIDIFLAGRPSQAKTCALTNIFCHVCSVLNMAVCNPVFVPANNYLTIFERIYEMQQSQLRINYISILVGTFRFFKYYQFQPRLQIVNRTLTSSAIHLFHFFVVFFIILFGFSLIGHLNFGTQIRHFATFANSVQVMVESLFGMFDIGPTIGDSSLSYVDPYIANCFFLVWQVVANMILLNIFVAILMDGYAEATEMGKEDAGIAGLPGPDAVYDDVAKAIGKGLKKLDTRSWRYSDMTLLSVLTTLDEEKADPVATHQCYADRYQRELDGLKAERDKIDERISFLEKMTVGDLSSHPFHLAWQGKQVTFLEVMQRLQRHPGLKGEIDINDIIEVYDSSVRYAEKLDHEEDDTPVFAAEADAESRQQVRDNMRKLP